MNRRGGVATHGGAMVEVVHGNDIVIGSRGGELRCCAGSEVRCGRSPDAQIVSRGQSVSTSGGSDAPVVSRGQSLVMPGGHDLRMASTIHPQSSLKLKTQLPERAGGSSTCAGACSSFPSASAAGATATSSLASQAGGVSPAASGGNLHLIIRLPPQAVAQPPTPDEDEDWVVL